MFFAAGQSPRGRGRYVTGGAVGRTQKSVRLSERNVLLALLVLLPPVGMLLLWRTSRLPLRGRMLLSVLSSLCLTLMLLPIMGGSTQQPPLAPTPISPDAIVTATEIPQETIAPIPTPEPEPLEPTPEPEPIYVYAVRKNAKNYHVANVCGSQTNRRELLLEEAIAEGLTPCPDCKPSY